MSEFHLYLISDSTGETVQSVSRACLAQFDDAEPVEHLWNMVRNVRQMDMVIDDIRSNPGFVLYTLVDSDLRGRLQAACRELQVPCVSVLQPIMAAFWAAISNPKSTPSPAGSTRWTASITRGSRRWISP